MTTRTWNGANDSFNNPVDWSGGVVPVAGDTAIINSGTVTVTGALPAPITVALDGTNGPTLAMVNATLPTGTHLAGNDQTRFVNITASGDVVNAGGMTFSGLAGGEVDISLLNAGGGGATSLVNNGGISVVGQTAVILNQDSNAANQIVNNGTISFRSGSSGAVFERLGTAVSGTGKIRLQPTVSLQLSNAISSGQQIVFEPGSGASTLFVGDAREFDGIISGFGSSDQVRVSLIGFSGSSYSLAGEIGTFTFTNAQGAAIGHASFAGNHPLSDFTLTPSVNGSISTVTITTSVADQPARVAFSDIVNDVSGSESGTAYTGPVAGLQYEYLWDSADSVAIQAKTPNMFLKGGGGGDALAVAGGNNVLDGAGGSNFLVGGTGNDTFFVDGRGGVVTWSSIVNFHPGDYATIFGFRDGQSTLPWTASDGVDGFKGATIHSELGGAGSGVNASITFAGIDLATALDPNKFQISTGNVGGNDYLLIHYG